MKAESATYDREALEKNFTSSSFDVEREVHLTTQPPDRPKDPRAEYDRLMGARKTISGSEFAGIGLQFAAAIVVFALLGVWLDRKLGTSPWFVIVLVLGGSGLSFWSMVRRLTRRGKQ